MNQAWYQVVSLLYGYLAAAAIVVIALLALRKLFSDAALLRRVKKSTPQVGAAGTLRVLSAGTRRLPAGTQICVPYEGTLGASHSCDVCIPYRRVHMRSAFFWMEKDGLHMVALHRDGMFADEVPVGPGDEAILSDGAVLRVRDLKLLVKLYPAAQERMDELGSGPYVTTARKSAAGTGRGNRRAGQGRNPPGEEAEKKARQRAANREDGKKGGKEASAEEDGKIIRTENGRAQGRAGEEVTHGG